MGALGQRFGHKTGVLAANGEMHVAALLMVTFFQIAPIPDQGAVQGDAVVRGRVVSSYDMRRGIPDATITATSDVGVQITTTNHDGNFIFLTLLPGNYLFSAFRSGFFTGCTNSGMPPKKPVALDAGTEYTATMWLYNACY